MKRVIGIFLSLSSLLTYLNLGIFFNPVVVKQSKIGMNSVVTTVKVTYQYPLMYWVIFYLLIITFILGIYFILAKEKKTKEYPLCDTLSVNGKMEPANNEKGM